MTGASSGFMMGEEDERAKIRRGLADGSVRDEVGGIEEEEEEKEEDISFEGECVLCFEELNG